MDKQNNQFQVFLFSTSDILPSNWFKEHLQACEVKLLSSVNSVFAHAHLQSDILIVVLHQELELPEDFIAQFLALSPMTKLCFIGPALPLKKVTNIMRAGAWEYLDINEDFKEELQIVIESEIKLHTTPNKEKNNLVEQFRQLGIIGNSKLSRRLYKKVLKAASVDTTILILGESGVGKELIAQTIHQLSERQNGPLIFVDCLSWPSELLEEELFGQEKNVFEGVLKRKIGKIEASSGGSIILNNAQALPLNIQEKLLRALQEQKFIRPGGRNIVFFNARLIVISSKDLEKSMHNKEIRKDLYYQLMGAPIHIPPLRKRPSDIPILANFFLRQFLRRNKLKSLTFTQEAKDKLSEYPYPGNIRELKTIVETSAMMTKNSEIDASNFSLKPVFPLENWLEAGLSLEEITYEAIQYYLKKNDGNVLKAAKDLKIGKSTIYRIIKPS